MDNDIGVLDFTSFCALRVVFRNFILPLLLDSRDCIWRRCMCATCAQKFKILSRTTWLIVHFQRLMYMSGGDLKEN
jgi:hypothetical protein